MTSSLRNYTAGLTYTGNGYYCTQADVPGQGGLSFREIYRVTQGSHLVTPTAGDNVSLADFDTIFDNVGWNAVGGTTAGDEIRLYGGDLGDANKSSDHWDARPRPQFPTISSVTSSANGPTTKLMRVFFSDAGANADHLTYLRVGNTSGVSTSYPNSWDTVWGTNTQWIVPTSTWVCCFTVRRTSPSGTGSARYSWQGGRFLTNSGNPL
jgi:hypothetical protein